MEQTFPFRTTIKATCVLQLALKTIQAKSSLRAHCVPGTTHFLHPLTFLTSPFYRGRNWRCQRMDKLTKEMKFKAKPRRVQSAWGFLIKIGNNISSYCATHVLQERLGVTVLSFNLHKIVRKVLHRWEIRKGKSNFKRSFRVSGQARMWTHIDVHQKQALRNMKQNTHWKETFLLFFTFSVLEATRICVTFYCAEFKTLTLNCWLKYCNPFRSCTYKPHWNQSSALSCHRFKSSHSESYNHVQVWELNHYFPFLIPRSEDRSLP